MAQDVLQSHVQRNLRLLPAGAVYERADGHSPVCRIHPLRLGLQHRTYGLALRFHASVSGWRFAQSPFRQQQAFVHHTLHYTLSSIMLAEVYQVCSLVA